MREITMKKHYEEFKVDGEIFKVDMSPAGEARFAFMWPEMRERLEKAAEEVLQVDGVIRELPEVALAAGWTEAAKLSELEKLVAMRGKKTDAFIGCAREIINARLLEEPFDRLFELCGGDVGELARVIALVREITAERADGK